MSAMQFTAIEQWAMPKVPGILSFFETIALSDLEGKEIRLAAATQRAILGFPVFGKQPFTVHDDGSVTVRITIAFGQDSEERTYSPREIDYARQHGLYVRPFTSGPGIFDSLPKQEI